MDEQTNLYASIGTLAKWLTDCEIPLKKSVGHFPVYANCLTSSERSHPGDQAMDKVFACPIACLGIGGKLAKQNCGHSGYSEDIRCKTRTGKARTTLTDNVLVYIAYENDTI